MANPTTIALRTSWLPLPANWPHRTRTDALDLRGKRYLFRPELTKRMHQAFVEAGGNAEYRMLPPFGSDGHFMIDLADAVPIWSPLVTEFLEKHTATGTPPGQQASSSSPEQELQAARPPHLRLPENIQFSAWQKFCFNSSDGTTLCRTTSTGTDDLDQVVVRVDLIERADGPARLQLVVPQGGNLQHGVKVTVDQGSPTQVPFTFCLSNICIAALAIDPTVAAQMEAGQQLNLELTDLNSSPVAINLTLKQFAAVHKGPPAQTFDFDLDQE